MKGLIRNLTKGILEYQTSGKAQRQFHADRLYTLDHPMGTKREAHFHLRRMARALAKLVDGLEKQIETLAEERDLACKRNLLLENEIDRLEAEQKEMVKKHGEELKQALQSGHNDPNHWSQDPWDVRNSKDPKLHPPMSAEEYERKIEIKIP